MPSSGSREPGRRLRFRVVAPFAVLALAAGWSLRHRLADLVGPAGDEARAARALAVLERVRLDDLAGPGLGGRAELEAVRFRDLASTVEGGRARAVAAVEAQGNVTFEGQSARLAYVGREQVELERCPGGWCPTAGGPMPRLRGVLAALLARQRALAAAGPARRVTAWQVRVERDAAEVGEDLEVGSGAAGTTRQRARISLRRQGAVWVEAP